VRNARDQQIQVITGAIGLVLVVFVVGLLVVTGRIPISDVLTLLIRVLIGAIFAAALAWLWFRLRRQ
jgi:NhaP-type Na+/H+ or K+/H+ antiporter